MLENASRQSVVRTLNRLAIELDPSDSVVVYYAGHGELVKETGLGYWQLADANPNRPETWMSNADISRLIGRIGASQVALISDSCYSGSLVDERIRARPGSVDPQQLLSRKTVVVMSSGGNEPVFDEGKNGHSPFAFSLMRNLEQVSNWQVGGNVFERVRFAVARELPQRPALRVGSVGRPPGRWRLPVRATRARAMTGAATDRGSSRSRDGCRAIGRHGCRGAGMGLAQAAPAVHNFSVSTIRR